MTRLAVFLTLTCLLVSRESRVTAAPPGPGLHDRVSVTKPTRLDWSFVLATRSDPAGEKEPETRASYQLFVPPKAGAKALLPVILFISPGDDAGGWKSFEKLAKARGVLFAAPRGAGNAVPPKLRARIVLDVLDDLRRHYPVDPDRTYLAGFSGGARVSCGTAFALPELFGGVLAVGGALNPREESWLRQRAVERLSVALLTGEKDFNRGELERWRGPLLSDVGIRARVWTQKALGHSMPGEKLLAEAWLWLEQDLPRRQALAKRYPTSRLSANADTSREALAAALLAEGKKRLGEKGTQYAGLMQIKGVMERWPDLDAGKQARKLLLEYEAKPERPWEADDIAEQWRFLVAGARSLDRYGSGPLDARYEKMRPDMLKSALELWEKVTSAKPDSPEGKEGAKRVEEIKKKLGKE